MGWGFTTHLKEAHPIVKSGVLAAHPDRPKEYWCLYPHVFIVCTMDYGACSAMCSEPKTELPMHSLGPTKERTCEW